MEQRRPETAIQLSQARVIVRGQQVETETGQVLEALVGLHARQPHGRPAFECEQVAGVAHELRADFLSCGSGAVGNARGPWRCDAGAGRSSCGPSGLGTRPVTVKTPAWLGAVRAS